MTRLDNEAVQWQQVDLEMNALRVAAETLNSQITGARLLFKIFLDLLYLMLDKNLSDMAQYI